MLLYRTVCSTDWKCRPSHSLKLIASSDQQDWLIEKMDEDILIWMAVDVATDVGADGEDDEDAEDLAIVEVFSNDPNLPALWWGNKQARREMKRSEGEICRSFAEDDGEGNRCTTVYHILKD